MTPKGAAAAHAGNAHFKMSESTVVCKTQGMVTSRHRLVVRSRAQVKLHKASHNRSGRLYPAFIVPHWYFLAFAGDRPAIDDGVQGTCQLRSLTPGLLQNQNFSRVSSRGDVAIIQHV